MKKFIKKLNQSRTRGQTFLLSILLLSAVSVMGITLITIVNHDLGLSYEFTESTKALYAADSKMENLLYWELVDGGTGSIPSLSMTNNTSFMDDHSHFSLQSSPSYLITIGYNNADKGKATVSRGMRIDFYPGG